MFSALWTFRLIFRSFTAIAWMPQNRAWMWNRGFLTSYIINTEKATVCCSAGMNEFHVHSNLTRIQLCLLMFMAASWKSGNARDIWWIWSNTACTNWMISARFPFQLSLHIQACFWNLHTTLLNVRAENMNVLIVVPISMKWQWSSPSYSFLAGSRDAAECKERSFECPGRRSK